MKMAHKFHHEIFVWNSIGEIGKEYFRFSDSNQIFHFIIPYQRLISWKYLVVVRIDCEPLFRFCWYSSKIISFPSLICESKVDPEEFSLWHVLVTIRFINNYQLTNLISVLFLSELFRQIWFLLTQLVIYQVLLSESRIIYKHRSKLIYSTEVVSCLLSNFL